MKIKKILITILLILVAITNYAVLAEEIVVEDVNDDVVSKATIEETDDVDETMLNYVYPEFIIENAKGKTGDFVEMKLKMKSPSIITRGGFTVSYNSKFENVECISSDSYIIESTVDSNTGKIGISFVLKDEENITINEENLLCTLKFKIPNSFGKNENMNVTVENVDTLYSFDEIQTEYYTTDGVLELEGARVEINKKIIELDIILILLVLVMGIVLIRRTNKVTRK